MKTWSLFVPVMDGLISYRVEELDLIISGRSGGMILAGVNRTQNTKVKLSGQIEDIPFGSGGFKDLRI